MTVMTSHCKPWLLRLFLHGDSDQFLFACNLLQKVQQKTLQAPFFTIQEQTQNGQGGREQQPVAECARSRPTCNAPSHALLAGERKGARPAGATRRAVVFWTNPLAGKPPRTDQSRLRRWPRLRAKES